MVQGGWLDIIIIIIMLPMKPGWMAGYHINTNMMLAYNTSQQAGLGVNAVVAVAAMSCREQGKCCCCCCCACLGAGTSSCCPRLCLHNTNTPACCCRSTNTPCPYCKQMDSRLEELKQQQLQQQLLLQQQKMVSQARAFLRSLAGKAQQQ
jgi:hypothetical protein